MQRVSEIVNDLLKEKRAEYAAEMSGLAPGEKLLRILAIEAIDARTVEETPGIFPDVLVSKDGKRYTNQETKQTWVAGLGRPPKWVTEYRQIAGSGR